MLDGDVILPADGGTLNERRKIAQHGQISVAVAYSRGRLIDEPAMQLQGVPVEEDREAFLSDAVAAATKAARGDRSNREKLREAIRLAVRRTATRWTGKKPIVDVLIVEG